MASSDWAQVGSSLSIQNLCLYDHLNLPLLSNSLFAVCQYGGPIAIALPGPTPNSWSVHIYMQNGTQIATVSASALYRMFWTKCQKLILLSANGRVLLYTPLGAHLATFAMGDESLAIGLADARAFAHVNETGLAVINEAKHIFGVNSMKNRVLWRIQNHQKESLQSLTCWSVLPTSAAHPTLVLLCHKNKFVLGVQDASFDQCNLPWALRDGAYTRMEPHAALGQLLLLHDSLLVQFVDCVKLETELRRVRLAAGVEPGSGDAVVWCGSGAIGVQTGPGELTVYSVAEEAGAENGGGGGADQAPEAPNFSARVHIDAESGE